MRIGQLVKVLVEKFMLSLVATYQEISLTRVAVRVIGSLGLESSVEGFSD